MESGEWVAALNVGMIVSAAGAATRPYRYVGVDKTATVAVTWTAGRDAALDHALPDIRVRLRSEQKDQVCIDKS